MNKRYRITFDIVDSHDNKGNIQEAKKHIAYILLQSFYDRYLKCSNISIEELPSVNLTEILYSRDFDDTKES